MTTENNKCTFCNKKLGLIKFTCRCSNNYCNIHRYATSHNCTYDYKTNYQNELKINNPVITSIKLQKI